MMLLLVLNKEYYSFAILFFVGNHHIFLYNFGYLQIFVISNNIIALIEISSQFWHICLSDYHEVFAIEILLENFELFLPFIFPFFVKIHYLFI